MKGESLLLPNILVFGDDLGYKNKNFQFKLLMMVLRKEMV